MLTLLQQDASVKDEGKVMLLGRRVETSPFLDAVYLIYTDSNKATWYWDPLSPPATASNDLWGKESLCFSPLYWCVSALIFELLIQTLNTKSIPGLTSRGHKHTNQYFCYPSGAHDSDDWTCFPESAVILMRQASYSWGRHPTIAERLSIACWIDTSTAWPFINSFAASIYSDPQYL